MPGAFLEHFRFSRRTYIYTLSFNESHLLVSFASLAELIMNLLNIYCTIGDI